MACLFFLSIHTFLLSLKRKFKLNFWQLLYWKTKTL
jgi:hypothetical protein